MKPQDVPLGAGGAELTPRAVTATVGALESVLAGDGVLPPGARWLVEALARRLEIVVPTDVAEVGPSELAEACVDPVIRVQVVRVLVAAALMDGIPTPATAAAIESFACALGVDDPIIVDLRLIAERKLLRLRIHLMRRFWAVVMLRERIRKHGWWELFKALFSVLRLWTDRALALRYRTLDELAEETLGRRYMQYVRDNGFGVHGERGALPEIIVHHDLSHVLAGYGTDPASEVQAACFQAGYRERDPFVFVVFVMLQFNLGVRMTPGAEGERGKFDPDRALDAIRRGAAMNRDLTDGTWNYWADLQRPVAELQQRYNVPAPDVRRASTCQAA